MYKFGRKSRSRLKGVDKRLVAVLEELLKMMDVTIIEGVRSEATQYKYFLDKKSKLDGKNKLSKHQLGRAVDLAPYPIKWEESERFYYMGGMVMAIAKNLGFKVRWGGDWDRDGEVKDQSFMDLVHIEILD